MTQLALLPESRPLADRLLAVLEAGGPLTYAELQRHLGCGDDLAIPLAEACRSGAVVALRDPARYERRQVGQLILGGGL